ncbi:MAG: flagellar basal-body rod protein FlgG [Deltaproteobacteria bacterium]|nr:flagellar basal-body rod protein FlgG [Deltaproteobacteria bacterium]
MLRALWTAAAGMNCQQVNVDVIANNLANVNTAGFKRSRPDFQDLLYQNLRSAGTVSNAGAQFPVGSEVGLGARVISTEKNFSQGDFRQTGNPLDLVIEGNGFFQVTMPNGTTAYTRAGTFKLDSQGRLTTSEGWVVAPGITIPSTTSEITVGSDGTVSARNAETGQIEDLGTPLEIARFSNPAGLQSVGHSMFLATPASGEPITGQPGTAGLGSINQGFVEMSNVSVVEEMVNLIAGQRAYEVSSKAIQASDEMLQMANNVRR